MGWNKIISRSLLQLGVALLFIRATEGLALPTTASLSASATSPLTGATNAARIDFIHFRDTTNISTSTINAASLLYLSVATSAPDTLGIANVSGVYGPGAWGTWFLTGVAAWWRIIRHSEEMVDVNTWAFIFGTNWAAIDVFRAIHSLTTISSPENEAEFKTNLGAFGAAFTVLIWGTFHALLQLIATIAVFKDSKCMSNRLHTLVTALILPLIALLASTYLFHPLQNYQVAAGLLPALYWRGMDKALHYALFSTASFSSVVLSPIITIWIIYRNRDPCTAIFEPRILYESYQDRSYKDRTILYLGVVYGVVFAAISIAILILYPDFVRARAHNAVVVDNNMLVHM